ncbi:hypothetical protein HN014_01610 [Aquimarina sp. TRL1]|uniref:hypothetical protein n=1 Tax=Aquimarina sp. (strain TRL1) TaxID=2736252 RepID=UPI001589E562|nr:hypothetical protein [Aquimarina sp. TRL1]QKX03663.1 hypothetical protein HN014_01610 [Aquimarina sp. TRL1]
MKTKKVQLLLLAFMCIGFLSFSQQSKEKVYAAYDQLMGLANTSLYNGTEFRDLFLYTDGSNRFFKHQGYVLGTIVYEEQFYPEVLLKYDLLEDNVIIRSADNMSVFNTKLLPDNISSFSIEGRDFVRLMNTTMPFENNGFFEKAYVGEELTLYIKQAKRVSRKIIGKKIEYSFKGDNKYIVYYKNTYNRIDTPKDVISVFPELEKRQVRSFYKSYKEVYKKDLDAFMVSLIKYLEGYIN